MAELYDENNEPYIKQLSRVYVVRYPRPAEIKWNEGYALYVEVSLDTNEISIQDHSHLTGMTFRNMNHDERQDVYQFLIEWELAEWRRIGPEDSELFATKKLIEQGERFIT